MSLELVTKPDNRGIPAIAAVAGERRDFATRFQPGKVNNPHGRPRSAMLRRKLMKQLRTEIAADVDRADAVADSLITRAETGDVTAFTALRDTVDGKPSNNDSDRGGPVNISIEIALVGGQ